MAFSFNELDCSPLVIDNEFDIIDEDLLASYVGTIILGHFTHVKRIINALAATPLSFSSSDIKLAIQKLKKEGKSSIDIEKRDGWIFQIISWLSLLTANRGNRFYCQQPHDAVAQHGLDGVALLLDEGLKIVSIIITEDKCTTSHRSILPTVWTEFKGFESGEQNNKVMSRVSAMIEFINDGDVLQANRNNIYDRSLWRYRVGINRNDTYQDTPKRKKLFKGYDACVLGNVPHRRFASTIHRDDVRSWMELFSQKVIAFLNQQQSSNV